jgi:hypothetical protein
MSVFIKRPRRSLKYEDIYTKFYAHGIEARAGIADWISFYNHRRPHQALCNRAPMEVWRKTIIGVLPPAQGFAPIPHFAYKLLKAITKRTLAAAPHLRTCARAALTSALSGNRLLYHCGDQGSAATSLYRYFGALKSDRRVIVC